MGKTYIRHYNPSLPEFYRTIKIALIIYGKKKKKKKKHRDYKT
jgi:hypothetical protein